MTNNRPSSEYQKFKHTMEQLLKVPHTDIKAMLDEEKAAKKRNKSRKSSSASREAV